MKLDPIIAVAYIHAVRHEITDNGSALFCRNMNSGLGVVNDYSDRNMNCALRELLVFLQY